jgi:hypothetical protein
LDEKKGISEVGKKRLILGLAVYLGGKALA